VPAGCTGRSMKASARRFPRAPTSSCRMHYTTIGQAVIDQTESRRGPLQGAAGEAARRKAEARSPTYLRDPPGDPNYEVRQNHFDRDTYLSTLYPHMHVRGKDATYTCDLSDGREDVVLRVPKLRLQLQ